MHSKQTALLSSLAALALFDGVSSSALPLTRRATFKTGETCPSDKLVVLNQALYECSYLAIQAGAFALNGDGKYMRSYFGSDDTYTRKFVSDNFNLIAGDCYTAANSMGMNRPAKTKAGKPVKPASAPANTYPIVHCGPLAGQCSATTVDWVTWSATTADIYLCENWWIQPDVPVACNRYNQASLMVNKMAWARTKGTDGVPAGTNDHTLDHYAYGWFSQGIELACLDGGPSGPGLGPIPGVH